MAKVSCSWCGEDVGVHCPSPTCEWLRCEGCGIVIDLARKHAQLAGKPVPWPEVKP